ncbi:MAG: hypothetical protein M3R00_06035 [Pseudomonadota bacterium]|nr:hypothetical protein [Pseudomonadota bacterium]
MEHRNQTAMLADLRSLVNENRFLQHRNLTNTMNFQAGMIKLLRNMQQDHYSHHGRALPLELIDPILNSYHSIDLENPNLLFREN